MEATVKQIQREVKASGATSPEAIQAAVFDAFAAIPSPAPLGDAVLNRIADKLAEQAVKHQHEARGTSAKADTLATREARKQEPSLATREARKQDATDGLYPRWKAAVFAPDGVSLGKGKCEEFIRANCDATGLDGAAMTGIWNTWLDRAHSEGLVTPNPAYQEDSKNRRIPRYLKAA